jgi:ABC-2 type transport system permease protein
MLSPVAALLTEVRHVFIDPHAPSASAAAGGTLRLLIPIVIVLGLLVVGFWVFNREAPRIAEEL